MATPKQTSTGTWRIQIEVAGQRASETLPTKRLALEWADKKRIELRAEARAAPGSTKTLRDALQRYADEVSPQHKGERWEIVRLAAYLKPGSELAVDKRLVDLRDTDFIAWRDARLQVTKRSSVLRDMGLVTSVLEHARREWKWIAANPLTDVRKPAKPPHRDVVIGRRYVRLMLRALGYRSIDKVVTSVGQAVAMCFLTALTTGMRASELCELTWDRVHASHVMLPETKNGEARAVPLSLVARRLIKRMHGFDEVLVFGLNAKSLDTMFRKARTKAKLAGFTFHDSRHTAATRIGRIPGIDVLMLCKIFGWKDTKQALTYYNPTAADMAKLLG